MERVRTIKGKMPVILFAPHGYDGNDKNTSIIAETIAEDLNAYAVINLGWERSNKVDDIADLADCNNVYHCHEDIVKEEILEPILRYVNQAKKNHNTVYMFNIHGMSNNHRSIENKKIDLVFGYGDGDPPSITIDLWKKNFMMSKFIELGIDAYEGAPKGIFSGWSKSNMNQIFRKWYPDHFVQSAQIEIAYELRSDKIAAQMTADSIATTIESMLEMKVFSTMEKFKVY